MYSDIILIIFIKYVYWDEFNNAIIDLFPTLLSGKAASQHDFDRTNQISAVSYNNAAIHHFICFRLFYGTSEEMHTNALKSTKKTAVRGVKSTTLSFFTYRLSENNNKSVFKVNY